MKILSFDVGIKNLAFCLIDKTDNTFKIDDWGLINLDDERKTCCKVLKTGKKCGKTAVCILKTDYYCKNHKPVANIEPLIIEGHKCCFTVRNKPCAKSSNKTLDNKSFYCDTHIKKIVKEAEKDVVPKRIASQNCNKIPIPVLAVKLTKALNNHANFIKVDEVYIENQPSLKNPTMKTISTFLYQYFTIRSVIDQDNIIKNIRFISPSSKLKVNKTNTDKLLGEKTDDREIYTLTKDLGEKYCKAILKHYKHDDRIEFLSNYSKIDDLCDSFLQGFYQLFCQNGISEDIKKIFDNVTENKENKKGIVVNLEDKKTKKKQEHELQAEEKPEQNPDQTELQKDQTELQKDQTELQKDQTKLAKGKPNKKKVIKVTIGN